MVLKVSKWDHGAFSPEWMTKALIRHMDRPSLDAAIFSLIDFTNETGVVDHEELLQILVQVSATHTLVQTFDPYSLEESEFLEQGDKEDGLPTKEEVDNFFNDLKIDRGLAPQNQEDDDDIN